MFFSALVDILYRMQHNFANLIMKLQKIYRNTEDIAISTDLESYGCLQGKTIESFIRNS